jgi:hypothetical protein
MGLLDWFRRERSPASVEAVPTKLVLRSSQYFLDGGTTVLIATDAGGRERSVMLVQSLLPGNGSFGTLGRLHLDGKPVPVRSELESQVLAALREARVDYSAPAGEEAGERIQLSPNALILGNDIKQVLTRGPEENIRALRDQVLARVESPEYVSFAAEVDSGVVRPRTGVTPHNGPPCPKCGRPLRTAKSQQCFSCGAKWHGRAAPA